MPARDLVVHPHGCTPRAHLAGVVLVDPVEAHADVHAVVPLEVVGEGPVEVAAHVGAGGDGVGDGRQVAYEEAGGGAVVGGIGGAVFGDHGGQAQVHVHPAQELGQLLGLVGGLLEAQGIGGELG